MAQLNPAQYEAAIAELDLIMDLLFDNQDPNHPLRVRLLELVDLIQEYESEHHPLDEFPDLPPPPFGGSQAEWEQWEREHDLTDPFDPDHKYRP